MSKSGKPRDPFAKREADNYDNPIPSRELILEQMEDIGEPTDLSQLCKILQLEDEDQREALRRRLIAMSRDGQIISNRRGAYGLAAHMELLPGYVQGKKDGFGFFVPDDGSEDMFLSPREMSRLFDGDRVLARLTGLDSRGRREGMIVEILARRYKEIVGRFYREQGIGLVVPDSKRITHEILIPDGQSRDAADGQYVVAQLVEYPSNRRKAIGRVSEILGDVTTPGLEIDIALRSHDIPHIWPSSVNKEIARFPNEVSEAELAGRFDLRDVPFVTIDGEDAKDFDDAVFARRHPQGGWTLMVAIADVSNYVTPGSGLDEEALERGTSVYFPGHVIPMLPEKLSNGLCSLKPEVDRLTLVCEMEISADGELGDFCFFEAVIHSHARLTYTEMADMVQTPETSTQEKLHQRLRERHAAVIDDLDNLYGLYHALRQNREAKGAMDFESTETRIVFGEDRKIREIVPVVRNDAHKLIEECMLSANVAAARLFEQQKLPALYRVHEGPNPDKLVNLREFLQGIGLHLGGGEQPDPIHYQRVLKQLGTRPDRHLLQVMLIRSMMQAVYSPDNTGHFGLGFDAYTHFTSPIRRYPDLLVHRGIRYLIRNKPGKHVRRHEQAAKLPKQEIYPYGNDDMDTFGERCSVAERRADAASYGVVDWLKCEYMQNRVGDEFDGSVSSVTSFGLFVELTDIYVEGLVHVTELQNDYYRFDPARHCLRGERSGVVYGLGDSVRVKVVRVDLDDKKIDLQMLRKLESAGTSGSQSAPQEDQDDQNQKTGRRRKGQNKGGAGGKQNKSGSKAGGKGGGNRGTSTSNRSAKKKPARKGKAPARKQAAGGGRGKSGSGGPASRKGPAGGAAGKSGGSGKPRRRPAAKKGS
ncbi:MAG: ribonuclease R [Pseudohongiellaceae bacterium]